MKKLASDAGVFFSRAVQVRGGVAGLPPGAHPRGAGGGILEGAVLGLSAPPAAPENTLVTPGVSRPPSRPAGSAVGWRVPSSLESGVFSPGASGWPVRG